MINTYNESNLHKTLKQLISLENRCEQEKDIDGYICDAVTTYTSTKNKKLYDIYEIQTHNFGKLLKKIENLQKENKVCLIYPLQKKTYIETYTEQGKKISRRKSPKEKNIYYIFDEITGIYPLLSRENKNFKMEVIEVITSQKRIKTDKPVQLINKSRKWKKTWYKENTNLEEIISRQIFSSSDDFLDLLPKDLEEEFTVKDVEFGILKQKEFTAQSQIREAHRIAGKMLWTFRKAKLLTVTGKRGNAFLYKKTPPDLEGVFIE